MQGAVQEALIYLATSSDDSWMPISKTIL